MQRVMSVVSADVFILKSNPPQVGITAEGKVPTTGWTNPSLEPWFYIVPPSDGIQDFDFVAEPPTGIILPIVVPISAHAVITRNPMDYWGKGKPLAGVRIHARENSVVAMLDPKKSTEGVNLASASPTGGDGHPWPWLVPGIYRGDEDTFPLHRAMAQFVGGGSDNPFPLGLSWIELFFLGKTLRVYHTGDTLTRDYRTDRANIELNPATERIVHVWFG